MESAFGHLKALQRVACRYFHVESGAGGGALPRQLHLCLATFCRGAAKPATGPQASKAVQAICPMHMSSRRGNKEVRQDLKT